MAAATVLFTLIPCAAATAQPRTGEPSGSTYYDWTVRAEGWQQDKATPSDGVTTQQELQQRARSQPKETYTVSADKLLKQSENYALTQPDPVSVTECREHFDEHPTRCDQAPYLQKGGCVFSGARPVLRYSKSNPAWTEFTQHLSDALSGDITDTKPGIVGKEIPGDRDSGKPLTRLYRFYDQKRYNRNNAIAIANCKKHWGKDYATSAGYPPRLRRVPVPVDF